MKVLEESTDAIDMYLHHLPDRLSYSVTYKIAASDDMDLLMSSRLEMLKVVNNLDYKYEYSDEIIKSSREYFKKGDHTTVLAMDGKRVIGCASICYMYIVPTFDHPTGKRAHLMNIYTMKEWQRQGIAEKNGIDADRRSVEAGSYRNQSGCYRRRQTIIQKTWFC